MKHLFFLLISLSLSSCTKFGRTHTAKGKVINPITGEGIPNAQMKILKHTLGLPGGLKSVKEATSDADGNYEISKSGLNSYSLRCELGSDYYKIGWYDNGEKIATASSDLALKMGNTKNVDFYAVPYGNYQLKVENISCNGINDTVIINRTNYAKSFLGNDWILTGCIDQTTSKNAVPMGEIYTTYTVIKLGVTNVYNTTFMVQPNQDNIQIINY